MTRGQGDKMTGVRTFSEAMTETAEMAKRDSKLYRLYQNGNSKWEISAEYHKDWLFLAYPGGRTVLSWEGAEIYKQLQGVKG